MQAEPVPVTDSHDHEPAAADVPEWKGVIERRLAALRSEYFGAGPTRRRVSELGREIQYLAMIAAWFEADGNITRAAERLGTSRRAVRERIAEWRERYPHLAPTRIPLPVRTKKAATGAEPRVRRRTQETQAGEVEGEASRP